MFKNNKNILEILRHNDELEVWDPLGSNAGTHEIDMLYYTLGNIDLKFRSKQTAVCLLAIANAKLVRRYGMHWILLPILEDLNKLRDVVTMKKLNDEEFTVYGKTNSMFGWYFVIPLMGWF